MINFWSIGRALTAKKKSEEGEEAVNRGFRKALWRIGLFRWWLKHEKCLK